MEANRAQMREAEMTEILRARNETYGPFERNAQIAQMLKEIVSTHIYSKWEDASEVEREAVHQIFSKLSRWVTNPGKMHIDSWKDIAGYALLVVEYLDNLDE